MPVQTNEFTRVVLPVRSPTWARLNEIGKQLNRHPYHLAADALDRFVERTLHMNGKTWLVQLADGSLVRCESLAEAERLLDEDDMREQVKR